MQQVNNVATVPGDVTTTLITMSHTIRPRGQSDVNVSAMLISNIAAPVNFLLNSTVEPTERLQY